VLFYAGGNPCPAGAYDLQDNVIQHARKGEMLNSQQRYDEALEEFKIALRLNPYSSLSASLYNNLGVSFMQLRNYPLALSSFQRAIRIQPHFELYYKNLIQTYQESGALSAAKTALIRILELNPKDAEAWYLLGLAYERTGDLKEAKDAFSIFLELEPNSRLAAAARTHL
jgi:tetratricopeptide (TPR) repeat protein